jgi:multisite-specific tRNA:(cytosine-C5)-methyltransferase
MPCLFVSSIDARKFPAFKIGDELRSFRFDKVLCDVPCSGDGTLRKNVGLWKNYHAHLGH